MSHYKQEHLETFKRIAESFEAKFNADSNRPPLGFELELFLKDTGAFIGSITNGTTEARVLAASEKLRRLIQKVGDEHKVWMDLQDGKPTLWDTPGEGRQAFSVFVLEGKIIVIC